MKPENLSISHIATIFRVSQNEIFEISQNMDRYLIGPISTYVNDKWREIYSPTYPFIYDLKRFHNALQRWGFSHNAVHGGVKGRSCASAAMFHLGCRHQANRDIKDCYPSIKRDLLRDKLEKRGFNSYVSSLMANLMTVDGAVPQGSPISSDAMNLYLYDIDQRIASEAGKLGVAYTRTYDDMVVSSTKPAHTKRLAEMIDDSVVANHLRVNEKKKVKNGFKYSYEYRTVHGIDVTSPKGLRIDDDQAAKALRQIQDYLISAKSLTPDSFYPVLYKRKIAMGWVHYVKCINPKHGKHLNSIVNAGDRKALHAIKKTVPLELNSKWWLHNPFLLHFNSVANTHIFQN